MTNDDFSEPPRRSDSKNPIFIFFCRISGPGHLRGPWVSLRRILRGPSIEPFFLGGGEVQPEGCITLRPPGAEPPPPPPVPLPLFPSRIALTLPAVAHHRWPAPRPSERRVHRGLPTYNPRGSGFLGHGSPSLQPRPRRRHRTTRGSHRGRSRGAKHAPKADCGSWVGSRGRAWPLNSTPGALACGWRVLRQRAHPPICPGAHSARAGTPGHRRHRKGHVNASAQANRRTTKARPHPLTPIARPASHGGTDKCRLSRQRNPESDAPGRPLRAP